MTSPHRSLGLTDDEFDAIGQVLGRPPTPVELAMFAVMWSEHCSYKSSRAHLRRLPSEAPWVLVGPGENAGVVDAGDGVAVALRIESHNHPSAIEPYQGAATGVGGILRDIFTMGARPIAVLDSLHFGTPDDARSRWLLEGVVSGVSGYGNAVGVPTIGGEVHLDDTYAENPLVNVMCIGLLPSDRVLLGQATGIGNLAVLLGSTTGRDGIGGVSVLASAGFGGSDGEVGNGAEAAAKRPSVQVGDPFEEKRLIEACLALYDAGLVVGIQDLGGAGLACATSETASRGGVGMDVDVRAVPLREPGMQPAEIMTSESQERMLAIVRPEDLDEVVALCERWEVRSSVVGTVNASGRLRVLDGPGGEVLADVPASALHDGAPLYHRPLQPPRDLESRRADDPGSLAPPEDAGDDLVALLADTSWVWSQYDHQLFLNTVEGPGGDAALLRLKAPGLRGQNAVAGLRGQNAVTGLPVENRALAVTVDSNARWCALDPRRGTELVVAEAVLNLACVGARAVAVVDCLNLGNPEHPEVMWQLSEVVDGLADACRALDVPVVGGNVSLYNESRGRDIDPTPVIGALGLVDTLVRKPPGVRLVEGHQLLLLGDPGASSLAGSAWATSRGHHGGLLSQVDYGRHAATVELVRGIVGDGLAAGVHDVSAGGLGLALAEMAVRSGVGFEVTTDVGGHAGLFGEGPSLVVACVADADAAEVIARSEAAGVPVQPLGRAGGARLTVAGLVDLDLAGAADAWRGALPRMLEPHSG